jgi:hypothetical protein
VLSLVPPSAVPDGPATAVADVEPGLADVLTLGSRRPVAGLADDESLFFTDTLAEYQWARDVAGLAASTLDQVTRPVIEVCEYFGLVPWRLTPRHVDRYFSGPGKRAGATVRKKLNRIDCYFAFLEQRYGGEIARWFGCAVESPVDPFNRPAHRGDFELRVPPSRRALREFFADWRAALPGARKELVACRDYAMAKIAYITGVRAAELCGVRMRDLYWESGRFGRFLVNGKGARGSGPRLREAFMFPEGRACRVRVRVHGRPLTASPGSSSGWPCRAPGCHRDGAGARSPRPACRRTAPVPGSSRFSRCRVTGGRSSPEPACRP